MVDILFDALGDYDMLRIYEKLSQKTSDCWDVGWCRLFRHGSFAVSCRL